MIKITILLDSQTSHIKMVHLLLRKECAFLIFMKIKIAKHFDSK